MRGFDMDPERCACRDWAYTHQHRYVPGAHHPTCPMVHDRARCSCSLCRELRGERQDRPRIIAGRKVT